MSKNGRHDRPRNDDGQLAEPDDDSWVGRRVPGVVVYPQAMRTARTGNRALVLSFLVYWLAPQKNGKPRARIHSHDTYFWAGTCGQIGQRIGLSKRQVWTAIEWLRRHVRWLTIETDETGQLRFGAIPANLARLVSPQSVFVPAGLVQLCQNANQAILLADICYWYHLALRRRTLVRIDDWRWIRKTHRLMVKETGLTAHQVKRALLSLAKVRKFLSRTYTADERQFRKLYLRPNAKRLTAAWNKLNVESTYQDYLEGMGGLPDKKPDVGEGQ